mmetsp:Transcript_19227/g.33154  ORF Transcript_19227/g.33154 Transcript_19227/m.33154 type:complete len:177 (+) Transcript_19227:151-681(+)
MSAPGRRNLRERKVAIRVGVVDESTRNHATKARLNALEADNEAEDDGLGQAGSDDDEFLMDEEEEVEISGKRKRKTKSGMSASKRKTRAGGGPVQVRGARTFARLLEDAMLDKLPTSTPSYVTAAAGPPTTAAPLKFCSVCGNTSIYQCPRCSSRFCTRRCLKTHAETQCLKKCLG